MAAAARLLDRLDTALLADRLRRTRALDRASDAVRPALARSYGLNLALNAAWTSLFFAARSPRAALAEITLLNLSNLEPTRRA